MGIIGKMHLGKIPPEQTPEEHSASERERLRRDRELDHLRELPWQRRQAYMVLYIRQLRTEIVGNPRIEVPQRERLEKHLDNLVILVETQGQST